MTLADLDIVKKTTGVAVNKAIKNPSATPMMTEQFSELV